MELGHEVAAALEGRPDDEGPWIALRHALKVCVDSQEDQEVGRHRATMLDKQMRWQEMLVPPIERRLHVTGELGALQARALVSLVDVAFGAIRS